MSDSTDTPSEHAPDTAGPPASAHHYVVTHAGYGPAVGTKITDDATIHELGLATAGWAVRVAKDA